MKSGLGKNFIVIKKDKLFLVCVLLIAIVIAILTKPFIPLLFYDEQTYVLNAQNIIENHKTAICTQMLDGECQEYGMPAHGIGLPQIYSLVYSSDYDKFIIRIGIIVLFFYLFNIVLTYIITYKIFNKQVVARISSVFFMLLPANIVFSTNVLPATICGTFFGIFILSILNNNLESYILSILTCLILVSIRIEYAFLAIIAFIYGIIMILRNKNLRKNFKIGHFFYILITGIIGLIVILFFFNYISKKAGSHIGFQFFNFSYIGYFFSNIGMIILCFFFIAYLLKKIWERDKVHILLGGIFLFFLGFYSIYNYPGEYRYLVPIGLIFSVLSAGGITLFFKKEVNNKYLVFALLLLIAFPMVKGAIDYKNEMVEYPCWNNFFNSFEKNNLENITGTKNNVYITMPSYLGQASRINTFTYFDMDFIDRMKKENRRLIVVNSEFDDTDKINELKQKYTLTLIPVQSICDFALYEVQ